MSTHPESWRQPDPHEDPILLQDEIKMPVERGEDYRAGTARRDLRGEASEADVIDQAHDAWAPEDDEPET